MYLFSKNLRAGILALILSVFANSTIAGEDNFNPMKDNINGIRNSERCSARRIRQYYHVKSLRAGFRAEPSPYLTGENLGDEQFLCPREIGFAKVFFKSITKTCRSPGFLALREESKTIYSPSELK